VSGHELLSGRREALLRVVRDSYHEAAAHSLGFCKRILDELTPADLPAGETEDEHLTSATVQYAGYPAVAYLGFQLDAAENPEDEVVRSFQTGLSRLKNRTASQLEEFADDDVAVLGTACGLARLKAANHTFAAEGSAWLSELVDRAPDSKLWTARMRALAAELLEPRGLLRVSPDLQNPDEAALELALSAVWPGAFVSATWLDPENQADLLRHLLVAPPPSPGELERAAVWLKGLDAVVTNTCHVLVPTVSEAVRLLGRVQHGLKRWVWKEKPSRRDAPPSRWLIDNEYDVQAMLWTVLYPVYGADLVDETYLEAWGFKQPRTDLGIKRLKLIIEVKFAREPGDFKDFEEQVAGDLGLYFKNTEQFDRMVVVVYDDCDTAPMEHYESLRNALVQRDRIEEVIFIRRPSVIPGRKRRVATPSVPTT
jgi:hypothetical protein